MGRCGSGYGRDEIAAVGADGGSSGDLSGEGCSYALVEEADHAVCYVDGDYCLEGIGCELEDCKTGHSGTTGVV